MTEPYENAFLPLDGTTPVALEHCTGCRWPVTSQGNTMFCNAPVKVGTKPTWCEAHMKVGCRPRVVKGKKVYGLA